MDKRALESVGKLPRGSGVLVLREVRSEIRPRLRLLCGRRALVVVSESYGAARRVHNLRELTGGKLSGAQLVFISPIFATRSHPDWQPLGRMRAATLARLSGRQAIALGGMDGRRFAQVEALGFVGWAGISAWLKAPRSRQRGGHKRAG